MMYTADLDTPALSARWVCVYYVLSR